MRARRRVRGLRRGSREIVDRARIRRRRGRRGSLLRSRVAPVRAARTATLGTTETAAVELVRQDDLHDLPYVLAHEPDDEIDDALLTVALVAGLRLRLLVLHEALEPLADELHDRVDDALLFEGPLAAIAAVVSPIVTSATVPATIAIVLVVIVAIPMPLVPIAVVPVVIAAVVAAVTIVAIPVLLGTRSDQTLERFQSFEDLTPIVVAHGSPPPERRTLPSERDARRFSRANTGRAART